MRVLGQVETVEIFMPLYSVNIIFWSEIKRNVIIKASLPSWLCQRHIIIYYIYAKRYFVGKDRLLNPRPLDPAVFKASLVVEVLLHHSIALTHPASRALPCVAVGYN